MHENVPLHHTRLAFQYVATTHKAIKSATKITFVVFKFKTNIFIVSAAAFDSE